MLSLLSSSSRCITVIADVLFWSRNDEQPLNGCTVDLHCRHWRLSVGERGNREIGVVRGLVREPLQITRTLASLAVSKPTGLVGDFTVLMKVCSHHRMKWELNFFFRFIVYKEEHMFFSAAAASLKSEGLTWGLVYRSLVVTWTLKNSST